MRSWDIAATVASIVAESIVGIEADATCQRTSRSPVSAGASTRAPVRVVPFLTRMAVGTRAHLVRSSSMSEQAELYKEKAAECERQAVLVSEEHLKKVYLDLAREWSEMA